MPAPPSAPRSSSSPPLTVSPCPPPIPAGKGAFGTVRLVLEKKSGKLYACKSISKGKLISKEDVQDVRREVRAGCGLVGAGAYVVARQWRWWYCK